MNIIIILLVFFILLRIFATEMAYDTIIDAIFYYSIQCNGKNNQFDLQKEFERMLPVSSYFFQFWNWDIWTIVAEEYRERIRVNYVYRKK